MAKFGDSVKKKVGQPYNSEKQGIEDAQYLYLPDASTHDIPKVEYHIPKELLHKQKVEENYGGTKSNKLGRSKRKNK